MPNFTITYGRSRVTYPDPSNPKAARRDPIEGGKVEISAGTQEAACSQLSAQVGGSGIDVTIQSISRGE